MSQANTFGVPTFSFSNWEDACSKFLGVVTQIKLWQVVKAPLMCIDFVRLLSFWAEFFGPAHRNQKTCHFPGGNAGTLHWHWHHFTEKGGEPFKSRFRVVGIVEPFRSLQGMKPWHPQFLQILGLRSLRLIASGMRYSDVKCSSSHQEEYKKSCKLSPRNFRIECWELWQETRKFFLMQHFLFILDTGLFAEALKEEQENEHSWLKPR